MESYLMKINSMKRNFMDRNRNLRTSRAPIKIHAHPGTSLFTSAATH